MSNKNINYKKFLYILYTIIPLLGLLFIFLYKKLKFKIYFFSIPCQIHDVLHLYCPGCGGTRALRALLNFDIIRSFLCNPFVLYLICVFLYYYACMIIDFITKNRYQFFHFKLSTLYLGLVVFLGNCIIRNVLAVYYNIDYLGDISQYWHITLR